MCRLALRGIGALGGFGNTPSSLSDALCMPSSYTSTKTIALADGDRALSVFQADPSLLGNQFPSRTLRRINRFAKMVALAAIDALVDAGVAETIDRSRLGIILATGYGSAATTFEFLDSYHADDNSYVSPMTFSNSVHASAVSTATILLGLTGPALTINQLEASVPLALETARHWIGSGRVDSVLVGGCDEYCDVLGYTYANLFGTDPIDTIAIGSPTEQSAIPGEGAAFALVTKHTPSDPRGTVICQLPQNGENPFSADLRIVGFDGHPTCGIAYLPYYSDERVPAVSLANLTGSYPTRAMVDVVAATKMLRERTACHPDFQINGVPILDHSRSIEVLVANESKAVTSIHLCRLEEDGLG